MAIRRLSMSAKLPRYVPLPTKDKDDPAPALSTNPSTSIANPSPVFLSPLAPSNPTSLYPPLPASRSDSLRSLGLQSLSKLIRCLSGLIDSLLPRDKSLPSHFRFRRLWLFSLLTLSATALVFLLSSFFHLQLPRPLSPFYTHLPPAPLDTEDDFRWPRAGLNQTSSSGPPPPRQIPFLLNRFGYPPNPSNPINQSATSFHIQDSSSHLEPVPSILHIVPPGKNVFSYLQWLSITSAVTKIAPSRTMAHMIAGTIPRSGTNFWWDETIKLPGLEVHQVPDPTSIFGNPILDVSHKTDVIRLEQLRIYGGIYLDTDMLVLRSFDDLMSGSEEVVMGVEKADGTLLHPSLINGLCNAVIVAKRKARFLDEWYDRYHTFQGLPFRGGGVWNYHSVILPWAMAKNASASQTPITVLDHHSFFMPLWDDPGLKWVHGTLKKPADPVGKSSESLDSRWPTGADLEVAQHGERAPQEAGFGLESTGQFAYHMWHHLLDERISIATDGLLQSAADLGPEDALERDSSFNRVARKYLSPQILDRYAAWKKAKARPSRA